MDSADLAAESLADKARCFSAFIGITRPDPSDRFILVMGMTGSGKSTFVARCTGNEVPVGHGLCSCTKSVNVFDYIHEGRRIFLVDTPGFNDTHRSDIDTLEILTTYLTASYVNGVRIHGIVMLHPISDNRMSRSSLRNIEMLKAMCGFTSYKNLAIATTMWPEAPDHTEIMKLEERESHLLVDDRFFGALTINGAQTFRHNEDGRRDASEEAASAQSIVADLISELDTHQSDALQLQHEMCNQGMTLGETAAGIAAAGDLHRTRQEHERQLRELKTEMNSQLGLLDEYHATQLQELKFDVEKMLEKVDGDQWTLKRTMVDMHKAEAQCLRQRLEDLDRQFRGQVTAKEQYLLDIEESFNELRKDAAKKANQRRQKSRATRPASEDEAILDEARKDAIKSRSAYTKFRKQTSNIINGTMNGLAAGTTSGIIAAVVAAGIACVVM